MLLMPTDITKELTKRCKDIEHDIVVLRSWVDFVNMYGVIFIYKDVCTDEDVTEFFRTFKVGGKVEQLHADTRNRSLNEVVTELVQRVKDLHD